MKELHVITAYPDYIQGYIRSGYYELWLNDEQLEEFNKLSEEDKLDYIQDNGELEISDTRIEEVGPISSYEIN